MTKIFSFKKATAGWVVSLRGHVIGTIIRSRRGYIAVSPQGEPLECSLRWDTREDAATALLRILPVIAIPISPLPQKISSRYC